MILDKINHNDKKCVRASAKDKTPIRASLCNTPVWLRPIQSCNLRKGKGLLNKIVEAPVLWNRQLCGKAEQTRTYETSGGKDDIVVIHNKMEQGAIIWFSDLQIIPLLNLLDRLDSTHYFVSKVITKNILY